MAEENVTKVAFGEEFDSERKYELIDDGDYEFVISKVEPRESNKNGKVTKRLSLTFKIRDDIEQKFKGRCVFFTIFGREGDPYYDFHVVNKIIITQLKDKEKKYFDSVDEVLQYLQGLKLVATVSSEYDDFRDEDRNVIVEDSFKRSNVGDGEGPVHAKNVESIAVDDSDIPF